MIAEVIAGVLADVITETGRRAGAVAFNWEGRNKYSNDLAVARWFDTYRLTAEPPDIDHLPEAVTDRLAECLESDEIHAVLHELLAARLTDAPEADVDRIRVLFGLTLAAADTQLVALEAELFDYYDGQIAELAGRLEGHEPALLSQIRAEAIGSRMIAILHAIERHTASLSAVTGRRSRADFLVSYRRHIAEQHGHLEPPDFERRRRIPVNDLYVSPRIAQLIDTGAAVRQHATENLPELELTAFADIIDRTVLLGDPGGGKTTASNVLMNHFATHSQRRIPFLVTLRDYAAANPPERSVLAYIEHKLDTFYQCPAPVGLISYLLLTGSALVIFDGLDELADPTLRVEVAAIVERFCTAYPLVPMLVTSRLVGYDEARLDDRQFTRYRIGGFTDAQVGDYVRRWFAQDDMSTAGQAGDWADAFMHESAGTRDLRTNPLMLALMCVLYRGQGSLPRSRAAVYEQCAGLLFRKWDARRRLHFELRAAHLLEPALRHLAWWLFSRDEVQPAVTEREFVNETTTFLHGRGFEAETDARSAATEFVEFCRGRLWVLSDTGTTASGEVLYSFTHRTFLEYFSAAWLAYQSDKPERLATTLAPHVARHEWDVVSELAVQIKDRTSDRGADRIYMTLLQQRRRRSVQGRSGVLQFLARSLRSVEPSPGTVRLLAETVLDHVFSGSPNDPQRYLPLSWLIVTCSACLDIVDDVIDRRIAAMTSSPDPETHLNGLRLAVWLEDAWLGIDGQRHESNAANEFWRERSREWAAQYRDSVIEAAASSTELRCGAEMRNLIDLAGAIEMPGGILPLVQVQPTGIFEINWSADLVSSVTTLALNRWTTGYDQFLSEMLEKFATVGQFILKRPEPPWVFGRAQPWTEYLAWRDEEEQGSLPPPLGPLEYLGAAAILFISTEAIETRTLPTGGPQRFGILEDAAYYVLRRWNEWQGPLPDLPVMPPFGEIFRLWADNEINLSIPAVSM